MTATFTESGYRTSRAPNGDLVIHDVEIFCETERDGAVFDVVWLRQAFNYAMQQQQDRYLPPLHVKHHAPGNDVKACGKFQIKKLKQIPYKGQNVAALIADLFVNCKETEEALMLGKFPYRSVELTDPAAAQIDGLALLDHDAPYLELPMLMTQPVGAGATDVSYETLFQSYRVTACSEDPGMMTCFSKNVKKASTFLLFDMPIAAQFARPKPSELVQLMVDQGMDPDTAKMRVSTMSLDRIGKEIEKRQAQIAGKPDALDRAADALAKGKTETASKILRDDAGLTPTEIDAFIQGDSTAGGDAGAGLTHEGTKNTALDEAADAAVSGDVDLATEILNDAGFSDDEVVDFFEEMNDEIPASAGGGKGLSRSSVGNDELINSAAREMGVTDSTMHGFLTDALVDATQVDREIAAKMITMGDLDNAMIDTILEAGSGGMQGKEELDSVTAWVGRHNLQTGEVLHEADEAKTVSEFAPTGSRPPIAELTDQILRAKEAKRQEGPSEIEQLAREMGEDVEVVENLVRDANDMVAGIVEEHPDMGDEEIREILDMEFGEDIASLANVEEVGDNTRSMIEGEEAATEGTRESELIDPDALEAAGFPLGEMSDAEIAEEMEVLGADVGMSEEQINEEIEQYFGVGNDPRAKADDEVKSGADVGLDEPIEDPTIYEDDAEALDAAHDAVMAGDEELAGNIMTNRGFDSDEIDEFINDVKSGEATKTGLTGKEVREKEGPSGRRTKHGEGGRFVEGEGE